MRNTILTFALIILAAAMWLMPGCKRAGENKPGGKNPPADKIEAGFEKLVSGTDLAGFDVIGDKETWSVEGDVLKCSGAPKGYLVTKKAYRNFTLRLDFRYPEKAGNSGYLLYCTGEPKIWPLCIEVQGKYEGLCSIFPAGGAEGERPEADKEAREKAIRPHNEWNSIEIVSKEGAVTAYLNGEKICQSQPYEMKEGPIGFQSEGASIHFRNLRIKEE